MSRLLYQLSYTAVRFPNDTFIVEKVEPLYGIEP